MDYTEFAEKVQAIIDANPTQPPTTSDGLVKNSTHPQYHRTTNIPLGDEDSGDTRKSQYNLLWVNRAGE